MWPFNKTSKYIDRDSDLYNEGIELLIKFKKVSETCGKSGSEIGRHKSKMMYYGGLFMLKAMSGDKTPDEFDILDSVME